MGAKASSHDKSNALHTKKAVTYDRDGTVVSCLFCRIAAGSERNPLWYKDDLVSVFVPRGPAATLHLLVVPNHHVGTVADVKRDGSTALLLHMGRVAEEQLRAHAGRYDLEQRRLPPLAPPPSYAFPRGLAVTEAEAAASSPPPHVDAAFNPANMLLAFHRPPYNSIDHLHLHAIYTPYVAPWGRFHFWEGSYWVETLQQAVAAATQAHK